MNIFSCSNPPRYSCLHHNILTFRAEQFSREALEDRGPSGEGSLDGTWGALKDRGPSREDSFDWTGGAVRGKLEGPCRLC